MNLKELALDILHKADTSEIDRADLIAELKRVATLENESAIHLVQKELFALRDLQSKLNKI